MGKERVINLNIDTDRCKGCELCVPVCPKDVLVMSQSYNGLGHNHVTTNPQNKCIGCLACARICPDICFDICVIEDTHERLV